MSTTSTVTHPVAHRRATSLTSSSMVSLPASTRPLPASTTPPATKPTITAPVPKVPGVKSVPHLMPASGRSTSQPVISTTKPSGNSNSLNLHHPAQPGSPQPQPQPKPKPPPTTVPQAKPIKRFPTFAGPQHIQLHPTKQQVPKKSFTTPFASNLPKQISTSALHTTFPKKTVPIAPASPTVVPQITMVQQNLLQSLTCVGRDYKGYKLRRLLACI